MPYNRKAQGPEEVWNIYGFTRNVGCCELQLVPLGFFDTGSSSLSQSSNTKNDGTQDLHRFTLIFWMVSLSIFLGVALLALHQESR